MTSAVTHTSSDAEWTYFVERHTYGHLLQTQAWAALKAANGWRAFRSSTRDSAGTLVGATSLLTRSLPYGLGTIAYAPRGPVTHWEDPALATAALRDAAAAAKSAGAFALVIEPGLEDSAAHRGLLEANHYQPLDIHVQPQRSVIVDISAPDEETILSALHSKTRYNIRLARKKGVTVRQGDARDAQIYHALMQTTAERDQFSIHPLGYYERFLQMFTADAGSAGALFIAEFEGQPLAALIATAVGDQAIYLYGASSNEKRELMPTYLVQWEAIRWARERGCTNYDLWGVPDEDAETLEAQFESRHDGLWGVYRFKRGFNGRLVRYVGAWAHVLSPVRWWAYQQAVRRRGNHGLAA